MSASLDVGRHTCPHCSLPARQASRRVRVVVVAFALALGECLAPVFPQETAAQTDPFGPFEQVRRQAHAYCVVYLQSGDAQAYLTCLQQFAAAFCSGISDFLTGLWCRAAATTPYPAPGRRVLTARSYRVAVIGGWHRERDPASGALLSERPIPPGLAYTLERQPNGLYLATMYELSTGQMIGRQWVNDQCEITNSAEQPILDLIPCPIFIDKPYLVSLMPPPDPNFPPSGMVFAPGRLADDFDEDGIVEIGYVFTSGSGGRTYTSGSVEVYGYDPETRALKFGYRMAVRESDNPSTTYSVERLYRFRGQSSP